MDMKDFLDKINLDFGEAIEETKDAAVAFLVGAAFGDNEATREFVGNLGGDPLPEQKAFDFGVKVRPLVRKWAMENLAKVIMQR